MNNNGVSKDKHSYFNNFIENSLKKGVKRKKAVEYKKEDNNKKSLFKKEKKPRNFNYKSKDKKSKR